MLYALIFLLFSTVQPGPAQEPVADIGGIRFQMRRLDQRIDAVSTQAGADRLQAESRVVRLETQVEAIRQIMYALGLLIVGEMVRRAYSFFSNGRRAGPTN